MPPIRRAKRVPVSPIPGIIADLDTLISTLYEIPTISDNLGVVLTQLTCARALLHLEQGEPSPLYDDLDQLFFGNASVAGTAQAKQSELEQPESRQPESRQPESRQPESSVPLGTGYTNSPSVTIPPPPKAQINDNMAISQSDYAAMRARVAANGVIPKPVPPGVIDLMDQRFPGVVRDSSVKESFGLHCEICNGTVDSHPVDENVPLSSDGRLAVILCDSMQRVYCTRRPGR